MRLILYILLLCFNLACSDNNPSPSNAKPQKSEDLFTSTEEVLTQETKKKDTKLANHIAPSISGDPVTSVNIDDWYSFKASFWDPDSDHLRLSIKNKPEWLTFDKRRGILSGRPTYFNIGTVENIKISVTDGEYTNSLPSFDITVTSGVVGTQQDPEVVEDVATEEVITEVVEIIDLAPVVLGTPLVEVYEGKAYYFLPSINDENPDSITVSATNLPEWMTINTKSGLLQGTPSYSHSGIYTNIELNFNDGVNNTLFTIPQIEVMNTNRLPTISGQPQRQVSLGGYYDFQPFASDQDGDPLLFSVANKPIWAQFDTSSGKLSGKPQSEELGLYGAIEISVQDAEGKVSLVPFDIEVIQPNRAPTLSGTPPPSIEENSEYYFKPTATDSDYDKLVFSISNKPGWAQFSIYTGILSGKPDYNSSGQYSGIVVSVSDGKEKVSLPAFSIDVSNLNREPTISGTPQLTVQEDSSYFFQPVANDLDGDDLSFSISNKPSWLSLNTETGKLTGVATGSDIGLYGNITLAVSDGESQASLQVFSITVEGESNNQPTSAVLNIEVNEDDDLVFPLNTVGFEGSQFNINIQSQPSKGRLSINASSLEGFYEPEEDFNGSDNFALVISNELGESLSVTGDIVVNSINDVPVASPDSVLATEGVLTLIPVLENDFGLGDGEFDNNSMRVEITSQPDVGIANVTTNGEIEYTADSYSQSNDTMTYRVVDSDNETSYASISIEILRDCANDDCKVNASLAWSPSTSENIKGYYVFHGNESRNYTSKIWVGNNVNYVYSLDPVKPHFFALTAVNDSDIESEYSQEVKY